MLVWNFLRLENLKVWYIIKFKHIFLAIERRYLGKLSKKALNFMKSLLKMDPKNRITSEEALRHPYFEGLFENDESL